ncbi:MAG: outer membrane protein assembly factor BamA [Pseudomonadota bacterium]
MRAFRTLIMLFGLVLFAGTSVVFVHPLAAQSQSVVVREITVEGTRRVDAITVEAYSALEVGQEVTPSDLNDALRRVFASGLFEDVRIVPRGGRILITVVENPTINQVAFEGNELIPDTALEPAIRLQPRRAFRRADVESDAQAIIEAYRAAGRFNAVVNPVIIRQPDNRVDVVFEIDEGEISEVERIIFLGNRRFSDRDLRNAITTRQAGMFSTFFRSDNFNADRIEVDREQLRQFYLNEGHADFQISSTVTELNETRDGFFITFTVEEGPIYRFGTVDVVSSTAGLSAAQLRQRLTFAPGETFNQSLIESSIVEMDGFAGELGYPFTVIRPRTERDPDTLTVNVVFEVEEGSRAFVERIDIIGNTRTLDRVIRREFELVEGDAFDARSIQRTADQLRALGFFSTVNVTTRQGSEPSKAIVRAEVEDTLTGSINFGVTFSSSSGLGTAISLAENNLLGRGQRLAFDTSINDESRSLGVSFTEPRFLDRDLALGLNVYNRQFDRATAAFQQRNVGFEPSLGFPISQRGRLQINYRISEDEIFDANDTQTVSKLIRDDEGVSVTSSLELGYTYDRRNSRIAPTDGYIFNITGELAGLGGTANYFKGTARVRVHSAFTDDIPFFVEHEFGFVQSASETTITDRFFIGGSSFRGFAFGGVGPRDRDNSGATEVDSALGGNLYYITRVQTSFPLGLGPDSGLHGGLFMNFGTLWGLDTTSVPAEPGVRGAFTVDDSPKPRVGAGFSIFWDSVIGPLRVDFGRAIVRQVGDEQEAFRLGAGRRF